MYFFIFIVWLNTIMSMINTNVFFDFTDFQAWGGAGLTHNPTLVAFVYACIDQHRMYSSLQVPAMRLYFVQFVKYCVEEYVKLSCC